MPKSKETLRDKDNQIVGSREVGQDEKALDKDKLQDVSGLGSATPKPVAQKDEEDEDKMSPMQKAAYRAKKKRAEQATSADQAAALRK